MPKPSGDVASALLAKGMEQEQSHHRMFRLSVDGTTQLVTRISQGSREIDDYLASQMARQCALQLREFWDLVDCPLSQEEWMAKVRERCAGGRNPFLFRN